jgi:hypothetical protein
MSSRRWTDSSKFFRGNRMKDGSESLKAKQNFEELQLVALGLSHQSIDQIADTFV